MGVSEKSKYFTKNLLSEANKAATREKRTCYLNKELILSLNEEWVYPIFDIVKQQKNEVRVRVLLDENARFGLLDMAPSRFDLLPNVAVYNDGTVIIDEVDYNGSPYSKDREWKETINRKPVRRQGKFRREVLNTYSNQCAVCSINIRSLLRAAHIIPVADGGGDSINNGICLCVLHEIAYDRGLLKIAPDGKIEIHEETDSRTALAIWRDE